MDRINLACGTDYREGWINVDNKIMYGGNMKVDIEADLFEFDREPESVEYLLLNHVIQYITPNQMEGLMRRWYQWLIPGGTIEIEAGDIIKVASRILAAKTVSELHDGFGVTQLYGIDNKIWNKWAWCPMSLIPILERAGFKNIVELPAVHHYRPERDFLIKATK